MTHLRPMTPEWLVRLRYRHDALTECGFVPMDANAAHRQQAEKRRHLARAVRLTPSLVPTAAEAIEGARECLMPGGSVESFVWNSGEVQAFSISAPGGSVILAFTSRLLEFLSADELRFVAGHEMAHAILGHWAYPPPDEGQHEVERLNLLDLCRAAEISADRLGFLACGSRDAAFSAILKLASGLSDRLLRHNVADYLDQARELQDLGGSEAELTSTHPVFAARVRAMLWFEMSETYAQFCGKPGCGLLDSEEMERRIEKDLAAAHGFRLSQMNEAVFQQAFLWGAVALFAADSRLTKAEQAVLARTFGPDTAERAITFARNAGPLGLTEKLEASLRAARTLRVPARQTLLADLRRLAALAGGGEETRSRWMLMLQDGLALQA